VTDGQHLPDQTEGIDALEKKETPLISTIAAVVVIIATVVGGIIALANVSSTATQGLQLSQQNSAKIEQKADKQDVQDQLKRIYDKLDSLDTYLRDRHK